MHIRFAWIALAVTWGFCQPGLAEELGYDNGEVRGQFSGLEPGQAEAMRLTTAHPARLTAVRAWFSQPGQVEIHVWADNGGQQPDWDGDLIPPALAEVGADGRVEFAVDPPLEIGPQRHFFVGHVVLAADGPSLLLDTSEAEVCRAILWAYSDSAGAEAWLTVGEEVDGEFVCRHYLARAEVDYHDRVEGKSFADVTEATGFGRPRRVAVVDYDLDGDPDVLQDGRRLLRNDDGVFVDVTEQVGLGSLEGASGGVFADFDRDGDLDLFVFVNSCCDEVEAAGIRDHLLRNDDGVFVDVTDEAGLFDYRPNQSAAWGDYDNDGYPDLFLPGYEVPGQLSVSSGVSMFHNEGDGTFADQTMRSQVGMVPAQVARTVAFADYDEDNWLDMYVGAYRLQPNHMFRNAGGFFSERGAETGTRGIETDGAFGHTIGAQWGDLDNDGDLDLVAMNLAHPRFYHFSDKSKIYLNPQSEGGGPFEDVREQVGIWVVETASEPALGDYDNDGDLDLFQTNVYVGRESNLWANRLVEEGALRFDEDSYATGARVDNGWGAVWADFDGDGDLDLLAQGLYRNDGPAGHWLKVRLRGGAGQDSFGIGAKVTVRAGDLSVTRLVSAGKGVGNQEPFELHFGLGPAQAYDSIRVHWLGGQQDFHPCGPADRSLELTQGQILDAPPEGCGEEPPDPEPEPEPKSSGCGCGRSAGSGVAWLGLLVLGLALARRLRA